MRKILLVILSGVLFLYAPAQNTIDSICPGANQDLLPGDKLTCIFSFLDKNTDKYPEQAIIVLDQTQSFIKKYLLEERLGEFYYYKAYYFLEINRFDSCLFYLNQSKNLIQNKNLDLLSNFYLQFAQLFRKKGELKNALEYLFAGQEIAIQLKNSIYQANLFRELGHIYCDLDQYTDAVNAFNQAQEFYRQAKDTVNTLFIYVDFAVMYSNSGNHPVALDYLDRAMGAFNKLNNAWGVGNAAVIKGDVLEKMGNYEKSILNYQIAEHRFQEINSNIHLAEIYVKKGQLFAKQKKGEAVVDEYLRAYPIFKKSGDLVHQSQTLLYLGDYYSSQQQLTKAHTYYVKSLAIAEFIQSNNTILELYQKIADNYYKQKDYKSAMDYKSKAYLLEKQFLINEHYLKISNLESKLAVQINQRDNKEKELLGSIYRERVRKKEYFFISIILFVLFVIGVIINVVRMRYVKNNFARESKIKQHKINRQQEYLKDIKNQFDEVNKTISRYFTITTQNVWEPVNTLETLLVEIGKNNRLSNSWQVPLSEMESMVMSFNLLENLLYWSRYQLNKLEYEPDEQQVNDLIHHVIAIQNLRAQSKEIIFRFHMDEHSVGYFDYKQIEIAFRNLVENAIKFSTHGSEIEIIVKSDETRTIIEIIDSGVGFTKEQLSRIFSVKKSYVAMGTHGEKGGGIGLALTKFFIEKNFGSFQIESSIAKGTHVTVNLPASVNSINIDSNLF